MESWPTLAYGFEPVPRPQGSPHPRKRTGGASNLIGDGEGPPSRQRRLSVAFALQTVRRSCKLRTVAVREGPFSMAKSHLKLVAPTEVNRTVAPNFEPLTLPPPRPTYWRASGRGPGCPLWPWRYSGGRTTPMTGRQCGRPWIPRWAITCHYGPFSGAWELE
jgi:hypothetical protein